jgi:serine protease Do
VVGVNSAIFSPTGGSVGIGFDIPADVAAKVTRDLIADGKVVRGYVGATIQDITPEIAEGLGVKAKDGALVADVVRGGPSDRAGLRSGDIVLKVEGVDVHSATDLTRQVALAKAGSAIHMTIRRDGREQQLAVTSGVRPSEDKLAFNDRASPVPEPNADRGALGLMLSPNAGGGVKVEGVRAGSEAAQKGLRQGDVIEKVGGRAAASAEDVKAAVDAARSAGRKNVVIQVARGEQHLFLPLQIADQG